MGGETDRQTNKQTDRERGEHLCVGERKRAGAGGRCVCVRVRECMRACAHASSDAKVLSAAPGQFRTVGDKRQSPNLLTVFLPFSNPDQLHPISRNRRSVQAVPHLLKERCQGVRSPRG